MLMIYISYVEVVDVRRPESLQGNHLGPQNLS
jgi:hypothetical protein